MILEKAVEPQSAPQSPPLGAGSRRTNANNEKYLGGRRTPPFKAGFSNRGARRERKGVPWIGRHIDLTRQVSFKTARKDVSPPIGSGFSAVNELRFLG